MRPTVVRRCPSASFPTACCRLGQAPTHHPPTDQAPPSPPSPPLCSRTAYAIGADFLPPLRFGMGATRLKLQVKVPVPTAGEEFSQIDLQTHMIYARTRLQHVRVFARAGMRKRSNIRLVRACTSACLRPSSCALMLRKRSKAVDLFANCCLPAVTLLPSKVSLCRPRASHCR